MNLEWAILIALGPDAGLKMIHRAEVGPPPKGGDADVDARDDAPAA